MCYSFDVIKKMAFTKEIEHIKNNDDKHSMTYSTKVYGPEAVVEYLEKRIKEIDDEYGEIPVRT